MILLYSKQEFKNSKSVEKIPCKCEVCSEIFTVRKTDLKKAIKGKSDRKYNCCSMKCNHIHEGRVVETFCANCKTEIQKCKKEIKNSKSGNVFCSNSCAATYNSRHKTHGTRRSKLEVWIEEQLIKLYPELDIKFNQKDDIGSELDIFIPSLNIAIELNGIFHYKPIYGEKKFQQIQENDQSKTKACHDAKIDLHFINTSDQKYFRESTSKKYLNIIVNIINDRLS